MLCSRRHIGCIVSAGILCLAASLSLAAQARAAVSLEPVGTYTRPVFVASDPGDENRVFVVEQDGRIQLTNGATTTEFVDLDDLVLSRDEPGAGSEQGLHSMAFAPDFAASGRFWVAYTEINTEALRVAELTASGDSADPVTLRPVIDIPHTGPQQIHYGGQLQVGPDGYLYISTGDAGTADGMLAQNPNTLLGKILRIAPVPGGGHTSPADNPLFGAGTPGADEVWSLGFRNPWRFSFDRQAGNLLLGDVGQSAWEEIDFSPASVGGGRGLNFGWPCREGRHVFDSRCSGSFTDPIWEYAHDASNCAITGGYVVRDPGLEELQGRYVYADLCAGLVRSQIPALPDATNDQSTGLSVSQPTSFGEDACGRIYVASYGGPVSRLRDGTAAACVIPPAITGTEPDPPSSDTTPAVTGIASADTATVEVFTRPSCQGPSTSGSKVAFEGSGITVSVAPDATTTLSARATDAAANTSLCSTGFAYTQDNPPPSSGDPMPPGGTAAPVPGLELGGKDKQSLERRPKVSVKATADTPGSVGVGAGVTVGKHEKVVFELKDQVAPVSTGAAAKLSFKLSPGAARRCRRLIADGRRVSVAFSGAATDAVGNRGPTARFVARLIAG